MKKHRKKIIITAIVLLLVAAILFVYFAFFHVPKEERIHRKLMKAHKASNTELLESDKFFDKPDFMIYEIGGEKIKCTPEEADAIYAEFEKMVTHIYYMNHDRLGPFDLDREVPKLKESGAVRFCYKQRRKYTGGRPHETPVFTPEYPDFPELESYQISLIDYEWDDFTFDEVLIAPEHTWQFAVVLGENGEYKLLRSESGLTFSYNGDPHYWGIEVELKYDEGYRAIDFDSTVKGILKIEERFPELFAEEK